MKTILLLILAAALRAQSITLNAPASVPSGQPIPLTVTYTPGSQPYWEITFGLSVQINTSEWIGTASICGVDTCPGIVLTANIALPDGIYVITPIQPIGNAADGSNGPVSANSVTVIVGTPIAAPSNLTGSVL